MTYNPVPPATGGTLDNTRDQIRTNFTIIRDDFSTNHGAYNTTDAGSHTRIDLVEQTTFPATGVDKSWMASREYNSRTEFRGQLSGYGGTGLLGFGGNNG